MSLTPAMPDLHPVPRMAAWHATHPWLWWRTCRSTHPQWMDQCPHSSICHFSPFVPCGPKCSTRTGCGAMLPGWRISPTCTQCPTRCPHQGHERTAALSRSLWWNNKKLTSPASNWDFCPAREDWPWTTTEVRTMPYCQHCHHCLTYMTCKIGPRNPCRHTPETCLRWAACPSRSRMMT